jgi:hypothetical protein
VVDAGHRNRLGSDRSALQHVALALRRLARFGRRPHSSCTC